MMALRWILGIVTGLFAAGWVALVVVGDGFRRSMGASQHAWWKNWLPGVIALLIMATVFLPEKRLLLHVTAVVVAGVLVMSVLVARETVFVATVGVLYCLCWLLYYYRAAWSSTGPVSP